MTWRKAALGLYSLLLGFCFMVRAQAGVIDAPGEDLEISLMTYGPGEIYWERFGHDSIRIRDRVSGEAADFNYGVFDPEAGSFFWDFARGRVRYIIDIRPGDLDQQDYVTEGRSVLEQRLALSVAQAVKLRAFLIWNLRPENVGYDYDYLTRNCATQVRDVLDMVLGGALRAALVARSAPMTYRQQIDRLMSQQPVLMYAMDAGLGPFADRPLNEWQESFLPMVLAREIRGLNIPDGNGGSKPLVVSELQIAPSLTPPPATPPRLNVPLVIAGLTFAAALLTARRWRPRIYAWLSMAFLVSAGATGTLLFVLWTLTAHRAAWANSNLFIFNPIAFALLPAAWRIRTGIGGTRLVRTLVAIQLCAVVLGWLLYGVSGSGQQNLPWLLFATPVWLVVCLGLIRSAASGEKYCLATKRVARRRSQP